MDNQLKTEASSLSRRIFDSPEEVNNDFLAERFLQGGNSFLTRLNGVVNNCFYKPGVYDCDKQPSADCARKDSVCSIKHRVSAGGRLKLTDPQFNRLYKIASLSDSGSGYSALIHTTLNDMGFEPQRKQFWLEIFKLWKREDFKQAAKHAMEFRNRNRFVSGEEQLLFLRSILLASRAYSDKWDKAYDLVDRFVAFPGMSVIASLELLRADPESCLGDAKHFDFISTKFNLAPPEVLCAVAVEMIANSTEKESLEAGGFVRKNIIPLLMSHRIPRWLISNPYNSSIRFWGGDDYHVLKDQVWNVCKIYFGKKRWTGSREDMAISLIDYSNPMSVQEVGASIIDDPGPVYEREAFNMDAPRIRAWYHISAAKEYCRSPRERNGMERAGAALRNMAEALMIGTIKHELVRNFAALYSKAMDLENHEVKKLAVGSQADLILCLFGHYWSMNAGRFHVDFDREWDRLFEGLIQKARFRNKTVCALVVMADSICSAQGGLEYAQKIFRILYGKLEHYSPVKNFTSLRGCIDSLTVGIEDVILKCCHDEDSRNSVETDIYYEAKYTHLLQFLSIPARRMMDTKRLGWIDRVRSYHDNDLSEILMSPERVHQQLCRMAMDRNHFFISPGKYIYQTRRFSYSNWEIARKYAMSLFFDNRFSEALDVIVEMYKRCDEKTPAEVVHTLVIDAGRFALYMASEGNSEISEMKRKLLEVYEMVVTSGIPENDDSPEVFEVPRLRIEIIKAVHQMIARKKRYESHKSGTSRRNSGSLKRLIGRLDD